jgi:mannose-6-phosphate isomerase-like protein (cupin superfamily)
VLEEEDRVVVPDRRAQQRHDGDGGPVERAATRRVIDLASGVRWERLTPHSEQDVEFLRVTYPVGAESCPEDALVTHGGREYGYVTSGTLGVRVGFDEYELGPDDSIAFDSSSPHRLWTIGDQAAEAVWVVSGRAAHPRSV